MPGPMDQYVAAMESAIAEQEQLRCIVDSLRGKIGLVEGQISRLATAIEGLLPLLPEERRIEYLNRLSELRPTQRNNRGSTAFEAIVALVDRPPAREWTAPDLYNKLVADGVAVEIEQVHNALNYLTRKGRLMRTSRGRYVPTGMALAIERVEEFAS